MSDEEVLRKLDTIIALLACQGKEDEQKHKILKSSGHTYSEISKITGIPEGTLKSWDHQKRKKAQPK